MLSIGVKVQLNSSVWNYDGITASGLDPLGVVSVLQILSHLHRINSNSQITEFGHIGPGFSV